MDRDTLRSLLQEVHDGSLGVEAALDRLKHFPYQDLDFARLDTHRALRTGYPEVVFCQGKTSDQVRAIAEKSHDQTPFQMYTRVSLEQEAVLHDVHPQATFYPQARLVVVGKALENQGSGTILVVSAGTSDIPVAEEAAITARVLGHRVETLYDVGVAGIHRLLDQRKRLFSANVLVVVAGMEGALASIVSGLVDRPVIAVPTSVGYGASFHGLAPLLTMLNACAPGVSVVNIDNGFGAGFLAAMINRSGDSK